jgi:Uma2 family endonuclease
MFAMAGASREHNCIANDFMIALGIRFGQGRCQTLGSDQRVMIAATGLYTYPDIVIVCGTPEYDVEDRDSLTNPTVIVEILSRSTEAYDRGAKFQQYQTLRSLQEIVLVSQGEPLVQVFTRQADGNWLLLTFAGLSASMTLTSVAISVPLADIYRDVEFSNNSYP